MCQQLRQEYKVEQCSGKQHATEVSVFQICPFSRALSADLILTQEITRNTGGFQKITDIVLSAFEYHANLFCSATG